jgi:hypothetical protein
MTTEAVAPIAVDDDVRRVSYRDRRSGTDHGTQQDQIEIGDAGAPKRSVESR